MTDVLQQRSQSSANLAIPKFCTACGSSYDSPNCPVSHDTAAVSEDVGIGQIVTYRRALRRRTAVVVGGTELAPVVLERGGRKERALSKFDRDIEAGRWMTIPSPLFRLESLSKTTPWSEVLTSWLHENWESLLVTIGDRRAFALAAIGAGDVNVAEVSGLSEPEIAWLTMHTQRDAGDMRGAYRSALSLASDTYPDHPLVLIEALGAHDEFLDDPMLAVHIGELPHEFPGWGTLQTVIGGNSIVDSSVVLRELEQLGAAESSANLRSVVAGTGSVTANSWSRASTGASLSPTELAEVASDHLSIADDLIDADRVEGPGTSNIDSAYLRARIDIESVNDEELVLLDAVSEIARRAYLSNDRDALSELAALSHPCGEYYLALDTLRRGDVPVDMPENDVLKAVAASLRAGKAHPNALGDRSTWPVLSHLITTDNAADYPEQASVWQLERALEDLYAWRFESAVARARAALESSDDEAIRDEALNIIAFGLHQQGKDEPAIKALEKALDGEYSANLQANIGIIARNLHPEIAAHHVGRLAQEAPTINLRLAAARHAFDIWTTSSDAWDEDELVIPDALLSTFRELAVADIPHDDYVRLLQILCRADEDWLTDSANTKQGPHVGSAARVIYRAKAAHDPSDYVEALAAVSKEGNDEEWFVDEKRNFVESLRSLIFSEEGSIGPAAYAFGAIDAGLELDDFDYVTLASGAAISIFSSIQEDGGLPSDKVRDMVAEARRRVELLDDEDRDRVAPLVSMAGDRYGIVVAAFHAKVHDEVIEAVTSIGNQLYRVPRRRINWTVVENAIRPMRTQLRDSAREVNAANDVVSDDDIKEGMKQLATGLNELAAKLANPRRMF